MAFRQNTLRLTEKLASGAKKALPLLAKYPAATIMTTHSQMLVQHAVAYRNAQLSEFLAHTVATSSWIEALAGLRDAISSGVTPTSSDIADVTHLCGVVGRRFDLAKSLFGSLHAELQIHRRTAVLVAFLQSCAVGGEYGDAKKLISALYERATSLHAALRAEKSGNEARVGESVRTLIDVVRREGSEGTDPLPTAPTSAMLTYMLEAAARKSRQDVGRETVPAWADALSMYVKLRSSAILRETIVVDGKLSNAVVSVCEAGGKWDMALRAAKATLSRNIALLPETYDAVIRISYGAGRFVETVRAVEFALASDTPLSEASLRRGLIAVEEVCAVDAARRMYTIGADVAEPLRENLSRWQLALHLFHSLADAGHGLYPQTYEGPLRAALLCDRVDVAMVMLDEMKKDQRWVPPYIYRLISCARIEHAQSFDAAMNELRRGVMEKTDALGYEALLRHCLHRNNHDGFARVHAWMRRGDVVETTHKTKLAIVAAARAGQFHAAVVRLFRLHTKLEHERTKALRFREMDLRHHMSVRPLTALHAEHDIEDEIYDVVSVCVRELQRTNNDRDVAVRAVAALLQRRSSAQPTWPQLTT